MPLSASAAVSVVAACRMMVTDPVLVGVPRSAAVATLVVLVVAAALIPQGVRAAVSGTVAVAVVVAVVVVVAVAGRILVPPRSM